MSDASPTTQAVQTVEHAAQSGDVKTASESFIKEASQHGLTSDTNPMGLGQAQKDAVSAMTAQMEKSGILPAVSVSYASEQFNNLDRTGPQGHLDLSEVRQAEFNAKAGSLDAALLRKVDDMMTSGQIKDGATIDDLNNAIQKMDHDMHSQDATAAKDAADLLKKDMDNPRSLFNALDISGNPYGHDGVIGKKDIEAYLKNPPPNEDPDQLRKLAFLKDHWDDATVRNLQYADAKGDRYINKDSLTSGIDKLQNQYPETASTARTPDAPATDRNPNQNPKDAKPAASDKGWTALDQPDQWGHSDYYSNGSGLSVSLDRDPGSGKVNGITAGADGHYQGWKYNKDRDTWTLYDGDTALAEAAGYNSISIDPSGKIMHSNVTRLDSQSGGE